jgi:hypothetical protein
MFPRLTDSASPKDLAPPAPIPDATWQAGVTPNNSRYRVLLNGEPQPLAFAASIRRGWVKLYQLRNGRYESDQIQQLAGGAAVETRHGHVEVIPGDRF